MRYLIQAACGCQIGKIRKNNEDNFFFDGKCLERENNGLNHPACVEEPLKNGFSVAVFDGMGGENYGEYASYAAARQMQQTQRTLTDFLIPEKNYLLRLTNQLNGAVNQVQQEMHTDRVGSTMVGLYFSGRYVYVCNVGDSRAYRLRDGEFLQLSVDHVEKRPGRENRKAPLTQYLGFGSDEIQLEPHIAKGQIKRGDVYLLCSDGLTDMLSNFEISDILMQQTDAEFCVKELIDAALERGGRDNVTAIVCRLM
jgi:protein phosphatase